MTEIVQRSIHEPATGLGYSHGPRRANEEWHAQLRFQPRGVLPRLILPGNQ